MTELRGWSRGQWLLRAVAAVGPLLAVLAMVPAGSTPPWWVFVLVGGLGVGFAAFPDSAVGTGVLLVVLAAWALGPSDGLHPMSLLAAAALLASHIAGTIAASGPGAAPPDPASVRRWAARGVLVLPAAVLAWGMATAAQDRVEPPGLWAVGLAGLLVAMLAANALFVRKPGS